MINLTFEVSTPLKIKEFPTIQFLLIQVSFESRFHSKFQSVKVILCFSYFYYLIFMW